MGIEERYGHLCVILLSGITLGLISGAAGSLGIHYDAADAVKPIMISTGIPALALGIMGIVGVMLCLLPWGKEE